MSGPGKLNAKVPFCAASEVLRRWTSKTAAGMLEAAVSPGMNGDQARNPTLTGASVSNSRSATG